MAEAQPVVVETAAAAPAPQAPVAPQTTPEPVVAPVAMAVPASSAMPALQPFVLPLTELAEVAQGSGLVWVNSDANKIAAVQAAIAAEPKPVRVPRERQAPVQIDAGPLVLVETKRDMRNMTLPFEANQ
jgi:ribonuclease E